ncbi:MAG TPA: ribonuclease H-like domain-containing protein [Vicinamibacterales bacterium]|nr:ribonuclease H-like domain-containing protein [Vicinamibacterales bacterium]
MTSLTDRLRGVIRPGVSGEPGPRLVDAVARASDAAELLGGEWNGTGSRRFLVVERRYAPCHRHGSASVADGVPPQEGWPRLSLLGGAPRGAMMFVDLETTGLAGGAGTYAFLVGCGWFDDGGFTIRQFFLSSFDAERDLLDAVNSVAERAATVVTFNGKSFDLPLVETRCALHRMDALLTARPHVDMLHPARRLWRRDEEAGGVPGSIPSCRLGSLEHWLLGHERDGDIAGFEIPARYFRYVHTGDAAPLDAVFEHNRLDLLSLALLTSRAVQLLNEGASGATTAREALGMGSLFEHAGMTHEALACFTRSAESEPSLRADALRAYAVLSRRLRRFDDAARAWQRLLELRECPSHVVREATEALAVHHEHRLRNLLSARRFALSSLAMKSTAARTHAAEHRLARLDRKIGDAQPVAAALF